MGTKAKRAVTISPCGLPSVEKVARKERHRLELIGQLGTRSRRLRGSSKNRRGVGRSSPQVLSQNDLRGFRAAPYADSSGNVSGLCGPAETPFNKLE